MEKMKNRAYDIGSIFEIEDTQMEGTLLPENCGRQYFSMCREILQQIARKYNESNRVVLIPSYTCGTVIKPFEAEGWNISHYPIGCDLRINVKKLRQIAFEIKPAIIIAHPYYGAEFNKDEEVALLEIKSHINNILVIDGTQIALTRNRLNFADYYTTSLRKWIAIPDGAFVEPELGASSGSVNDAYLIRQLEAMRLRYEYVMTGDTDIKERSRILNKEAIKELQGYDVSHAMSDFSSKSLSKANWEEIEKIRKNNFICLSKGLSGKKTIRTIYDESDLTTAPLYFPIYCEERTLVQNTLAEHRIYAPILWPMYNETYLIDDDTSYIYQHLLAIPVDQRYNADDMQEIIEVLNTISA